MTIERGEAVAHTIKCDWPRCTAQHVAVGLKYPEWPPEWSYGVVDPALTLDTAEEGDTIVLCPLHRDWLPHIQGAGAALRFLGLLDRAPTE